MTMWYRLTFVYFIVGFSFLQATVVGSDSTPSRQGAVTFLQVDSDNEMNGFAAFEDGFTLETANATCTFDSFFPVSGTVNMNGGTLYLSNDLVFDSGTNLGNLGNIYGYGNKVVFSESITTLTVYSQTSGSAGSWQQLDSENLSYYDVNSVDLSYDDQYVVAVVDGNFLGAYSFNGSALTYVHHITTYAAPHTVRAHPSGYYFLVNVSAGYEVRLYKLSGSTLSRIDYDDTNEEGRAVDWAPSGDYAVVGSTVNLRIFSFASENISRVTSLSLGSGEDVSKDAIVWDQTGDYIAAGITHSTNSKLRIYYFNGSTLTTKDYADTGADAVTAVDWSHTGNFIAAGTNGGSNQLRVYEYNSGTDTLTQRNSISVGGTVLSVHWNSDTTKLLVGKANDSGGTELRVYSFNSEDYSLTLGLEVEKTTNINSVRWSHDDSYIAYGDDANRLVVYSYSPPVEGAFASSAILDNVSISLNNNMSWKMATTIQGECTINGGGNSIAIEGAGVITVNPGATLTLEHVELRGLTNQNFTCYNNSASIVFRDCIVRLDHDFTFDTGSILFEQDVVFTGTNMFVYASDQVSTIAANATLMFDHDTTFKYAPSVANRDLLAMTDEMSFLYLNGCTLHSTTTGIRLTRGTLFLENDVTFLADGSETSEAICFGDGVESDNDLTIKILSDAVVDVYGDLYCNNVN